MTAFNDAFTKWLAGANAIVSNYYKDGSPNLKPELTGSEGDRYIRVESRDKSGGCSAFCFIDKTTGEVLKSGSWKAPAKTKGKRGNIFDDQNGLGSVGPYGLRYLK